MRGQVSAAPVPNAEKWSHEAIVAFVKCTTGADAETHALRGIRGRILSFEYLQECWDDPALQIVIKKLLAKYPQWGIVIVDEVLIDWNAKLK